MSLDTVNSGDEPSPWRMGEGRRARDGQPSSPAPNSGGVGVEGTLGRPGQISWEACGGGAVTPPPAVQAGSTGKTEGAATGVGEAHSKLKLEELDLSGLNEATRAYLKEFRPRGFACSHARQRREGAGDGPEKSGIGTPDKIRKLQRALYRKAKAEPKYRFYSLYGDICRRDILEEALRRVARNGGAAGVDGETIASIQATPESHHQWLHQLQEELKAKTYRPQPVRRVLIPKGNGGTRPLGIPTVRDRVAQMAAVIVLEPIFEADFHPRSFGFRPKRSAHQAMDEIVRGLLHGRTEVIDADLSKYFDTIPHRELLRKIARRISDGSVLKLIKEWLRAPVVEEDKDGRKRILPNPRGTPQGGVISPLLSNLYLNALDWAVNEKVPTKPRLIRYADDFVILCRPGQGGALRERLDRWVEASGLKLNEEKTRLVDSRQEAFQFLGFTVRWQKSWRSGRAYVHVEPSAKSRKKFHEQVRAQLNHWTLGRRVAEAMTELNRYLRGWSQYFHYAHGARVIGKLQWWTRDRLRRWLWRKHQQTKALWSDYPDELLHGRYGLWRMPTHPAWKTKRA